MDLSNPNILENTKRLERYDEELRKRNLGYLDLKTSEIVFDEKDETEVCALLDKCM